MVASRREVILLWPGDGSGGQAVSLTQLRRVTNSGEGESIDEEERRRTMEAVQHMIGNQQ